MNFLFLAAVATRLTQHPTLHTVFFESAFNEFSATDGAAVIKRACRLYYRLRFHHVRRRVMPVTTKKLATI